jgi:hypothetical protein
MGAMTVPAWAFPWPRFDEIAGGKLDIDSEINVGTTVVATFPAGGWLRLSAPLAVDRRAQWYRASCDAA